MSNIEERVVVLKFDNSSFEQNTRQSMKTLDDLNGKLNNTNSAKGLKNLTNEANSIDLSNITKAADTINKRFSLMGELGHAAISKVADAVVSKGKSILTAIPTQIWQGGWQRALNIEQAKFQIEGLGKLWDKSSVSAKAWAKEVEKAGSEAKAALKFGKTVEEGKQAFQDLKWADYVKKMGGETKAEATLLKNNVLDAVRGTAAGLDEAGKVASQLAASGMKAGTEMTESLRGIAGASAMTGDSFSNIGNIFTTVAGNGRLMTEQLNQFASRGLNAAATLTEYLNKNKEAREQAIETGLQSKNGAKDVAEFADATKLTEANIRKLVTAGGISFKTFSHAMSDAFGEHATKANDTYTGSLANMKAALSRIGADVQTQRLENLRKIFNTLTPIIDGIHDKLGPFIEKINKASAKVTSFFTGGLTKIAKAFGWIKDEEGKAEKKTDKVKDIAGKALKKVTGDAKDTGKTLHLTSKEYQAALDIWNKGTYGNGEERVRGLKAVGLSYHRVQSFINAACDAEWNLDKVNYKVTDNMTKSLKKVGKASKKNAQQTSKLSKEELKAQKERIKRAEAQHKAYEKLSAPLKVLFQLVRSIRNIGKGLANIFKPLASAFSTTIFTHNKERLGFFQLLGKGATFLAEKIGVLTDKFAILTERHRDDIYSFFRGVFEKIAIVIGWIKKGIVAIAGWVKSFVNFLRTNQTAQRLFHALGAAIKTVGLIIVQAAKRIKEFFVNLKNNAGNSKLAESFRKLWEAIKPLASLVFNKIAEGLERFAAAGGKVNFVDALAKGLGKLGEWMSKIVDLATGGVDKVKGFFGAFKKDGKTSDFKMEVVGKDAEQSQSALGRFLDAIKRFDIKGAFGIAIGALKDGLKKLFEILSGGKIGDIFKKIKGGFEKFDLDKWLKRAWNIAKIVGVIKGVFDLGKMASSASGALNSIGGFFSKLSGTLTSAQDNMKKRTNAAVFKSIAAGILMIAVSALIISKINKEGLIKAGVVIGGFLFAMIMMMKYISKLRSDQMAKSAAVLLSIGISILMISIAMKKIAGLSGGAILKGIAVISLFIGIFLLVSKISAQVAKGSLSFAAMALSIDLLIPALIILSKLKGETIMKGGAAILYLAVIMAAASRIASSNKKSSAAFIAMALAITAMVPAIVVLALLPFERALKAVTMLSVLLLVLSGSARLASSSKSGVSSMLAMATVIGTLTASLVILSLIPWPKLLLAASSLTAVFIAFGVAGKAAEASKSGIILMTVVFGILVGALILLSKLHLLNQAILFAFSLAILATALAVACNLLGKIPIQAALMSIANLAILMFGLVGILAAMGGLAKIPGLKELIKGGEGILGQIGHAIGYFIGSLLSGTVVGMAGSLPLLAASIAYFVKSITPVLEMVSGIGKKPIEGFKNLAAAILMITGAQFLDALLHIDSITKMTTFAGQIDALIDALLPIVPKASKFDGKELDKFNKVAQAVKAFAVVAKAIPQSSENSLATKILGMKDIGKFGSQLGTFMEEWSKVAGAVNNSSGEGGKMSPEAMAHMKKVVAPAIKAYADIAQAIPQNSNDSLATAFLGMKDLSKFGAQLKGLITSFSEAAPEAASVKPEMCEHLRKVIKPCIKAFVDLNEEVPDGGLSVKSFFAGKGDHLGDFGDDIKDLIKAFVKASDEIAGVKDLSSKISSLKKVKTVVKIFAELSTLEGIQSNGGVKLALMGRDIKNLMPHIVKAANQAGGLDEEKLKNIKAVAKTLPTVASNYSKAVGSVDAKATGDVVSMATKLVKYAKKLNKVDTGNLTKNASNIRKSIDKILSNSSKTGTKAGQNVVKEYAATIKGSASYAKTAAKTVVKEAKKGLTSNGDLFYKQGKSVGGNYVKGLKTNTDSSNKAGKKLSSQAKKGLTATTGWYKAGEDAGKGFVNGVNSMKDLAYTAGHSLGAQAVQGAKDATEEKSPSKVFAKIGRFAGAGLVIGMQAYEDKVYNSGSEMGMTAIDGVNDVINDIDANPTITPVLDLTDVVNGARQIGGLLGGQNVNASLISGAQNQQLEQMSKLISKMDQLASSQDSGVYNITMNIDGTESPQEWGEKLIAEVKRRSRMGV